MISRNIAVFLVAVFVFCACSSRHVYVLKLSTPLKDKSALQIEIEVEFEDENGVREIESRIHRIEYAFSLSFRVGKKDQLGSSAKRKVLRVIKNIFKSQLKSQPKSIRITKYTIS